MKLLNKSILHNQNKTRNLDVVTLFTGLRQKKQYSIILVLPDVSSFISLCNLAILNSNQTNLFVEISDCC